MTDDDMLAEFVRESNAIEGIYAVPGEPLYDDHLDEARHVFAAAEFMDIGPRNLHETLMASEPSATPGMYRKVDVMVGGYRKMPWRDVPGAMEKLLDRAAVPSLSSSASDAGQWCWGLHHEFEHIHPFRDGNGRTGRLWMNALRLAHGLSWLTVYARDRQAYYDSIRAWERERA